MEEQELFEGENDTLKKEQELYNKYYENMYDTDRHGNPVFSEGYLQAVRELTERFNETTDTSYQCYDTEGEEVLWHLLSLDKNGDFSMEKYNMATELCEKYTEYPCYIITPLEHAMIGPYDENYIYMAMLQDRANEYCDRTGGALDRNRFCLDCYEQGMTARDLDIVLENIIPDLFPEKHEEINGSIYNVTEPGLDILQHEISGKDDGWRDWPADVGGTGHEEYGWFHDELFKRLADVTEKTYNTEGCSKYQEIPGFFELDEAIAYDQRSEEAKKEYENETGRKPKELSEYISIHEKRAQESEKASENVSTNETSNHIIMEEKT